MTTQQDDTAQWIADGQDRGAGWLIIVYDAQTGRQTPVYVMPGENLEQKRKECNSGSRTEVTAPIDL
jgi:hypothetical protein